MLGTYVIHLPSCAKAFAPVKYLFGLLAIFTATH